MAVNAFRADYQQRRLRTLLAAGRIRSIDADARQQVIAQRLGQIDSISLEQLIDGRIQDELAAKQGVTVTDAEIDARIADEATTPELRHAWMIAVKPELATGESVATDAEKAAAKAKAEAALVDLKAGKDWETVAKAVSTDTTKEQAGDISYIDKDAALDTDFRTRPAGRREGHPDGRDRGRGRHLPDRPGDRDHPGGGRRDVRPAARRLPRHGPAPGGRGRPPGGDPPRGGPRRSWATRSSRRTSPPPRSARSRRS